MVPTESASLENGGRGDGGRGGEARRGRPPEGLIPPESSVRGRGGRPGRCVLEAPVGEDALGKLLLGPLEAGARAAIQGMHLGKGAGGKTSACGTRIGLAAPPGRAIPPQGCPTMVLSCPQPCEELTCFRRKSERTAQSVKNAATTIMMTATARFPCSSDSAAIQPLQGRAAG